jgi:ADP-ribose pyrophosphatase
VSAEPLSSRSLFDGHLIDLRVERWPVGEREVVHHPGACAVVALTPSGDVLLVRQFREAVRTELLEIPAGIRDVDGESPPDCAARELVEETGHEVVSIEPLGSILTSPGFADERIELFIAAASEDRIAPAIEDAVRTVRVPFADALRAVRRGEIVDAKTVAALLLAEDRPISDRK